MIQKLDDLNDFHKNEDPWNYKRNTDDQKRLEILMHELPKTKYNRILDIGCGQGFLTQHLPGNEIIGVDISAEAVKHASKLKTKKLSFKQLSIFDLKTEGLGKFDLIVITGVLYPQYIGESSSLIYLTIDNLLNENGTLISVHINEWYNLQFPYLKIKQMYYDYRDYTHNLEIYNK